MNKKVLIGVGIGCGSLVLLAVAAIVAGGLWFRNKVGNAVEVAQKAKAQNQELDALDAKYPFSAPPKGQPLRLEEARLTKYLAVQQEALTAYSTLREKTREIEAQREKDVGVGNMLAAASIMVEQMSNVRTAFISSLGKQEMSPREFFAITRAIYEPMPGPEVIEARRVELGSELDGVKERLKDPTLPPEEKKALEEELQEVTAELDELPSEDGSAREILAANATLVEKYKAQLERELAPDVSSFLIFDRDNARPLGAAADQPGRDP